MEGHGAALDPLGLESPRPAIVWVSKRIMPLAELEAEPQPFTCLVAFGGHTKEPLVL